MGQILTAFGAGVLSFFSPCILPLLPAYLSLLSGFSAEELKNGSDINIKRILFRAILFCLGFSIVFILMGAAVSSVGGTLSAYKGLLLKIFGIITILFGIHTAGYLNIRLLNYEKRIKIGNDSKDSTGAFLMGIAFAMGWSPCIGPVLGSILAMAIVKGTTLSGILLLTAYSAGITLPLLITAMFTAKLFSILKNMRKHLNSVKTLSGIILIILGLLLFFDKLMFIG